MDLLESESSDDGKEGKKSNLTINKRYASKFEAEGRFKDLQRAKELSLNSDVDENSLEEQDESSESEDEGIKIWCGSLHPKAANADQILALDMQLQKVCQCGGKVGTGLGARPAEIVEKYPGEGGPIECTADCGNPRRGSLTSCYVQITRRGQGTDTTYHVQPLPFSEPNADHSMAPMDLAEIYKADLNANVEMLEARGISIRQDLNGTSTSDSNIWN